MLSITDENDGTFGSSNCRKCSSSLWMTVHLCNDDWSNINCFSESLSLCITLLTNWAIHNEDDVIRLDCFLDLFHFIKKLSLLFVTSWCINYNDVHTFLFELSNTFFGYCYRISLDITSIEGDSYLRCVLFKLIKGSCSESISTNHGNSPSLFFIIVGNFTASGSFSTTL